MTYRPSGQLPSRKLKDPTEKGIHREKCAIISSWDHGRLDIARRGGRNGRGMKFLKRRLRSLALAGRKCVTLPGATRWKLVYPAKSCRSATQRPDAGLSLSRRAAALNSKT
jgi:hypothetical protein